MPKRIDLAAQREMITTAAIAVINEAGLEGTRLRDVARAANVTTGAVTHYFDGKDAVLEGALREIVKRTLDRMEPAGEAASSVDVDEFIGRVCSYLPTNEERRAEWRVWLAFWGRAIADERLRTVHKNHYAEIVSRLTKALGLLKARGDPPSSAQLRTLADAIIAAIDGLGTRATLEPELWPRKRQHEALRNLLRPMLAVFASGTDPA